MGYLLLLLLPCAVIVCGSSSTCPCCDRLAVIILGVNETSTCHYVIYLQSFHGCGTYSLHIAKQ
jgi:hypothetical protein